MHNQQLKNSPITTASSRKIYKLRLRNGIVIFKKENKKKLQVGVTPSLAWKIGGAYVGIVEEIVRLLDKNNCYKNPLSTDKLYSHICSHFRCNIKYEEFIQILEDLEKIGILIKEEKKTQNINCESDSDYSLYHRQLLLFNLMNLRKPQESIPYIFQKRLFNAHVLVFGVGGIGSWLIYFLTLFGVRNLTIVDYDIVELSNLNRMAGTSFSDLGKPKIEVLSKFLKSVAPKLNVRTLDKKIDNDFSLKEIVEEISPDVIVKAVDYPLQIAEWFDKVSKETGIPWIGGGYTEFFGFVGPFVIPNKSCYFQDWQKKHGIEDIEVLNQNYNACSLVTIANSVASLVAMEIFYYITQIQSPVTINKRLILDFRNYSVYFDEIECNYRKEGKR